eukprot:TRINITY_DN1135_c0_g1_i1.p1 TRINITY_DN1135_c0_g1~~TRINITY_DN1135_c0_g1_i1.p1  ORF type:complete len:238 (-),score=68.44 TRINITY_DN1135_c0_g1_i1:58-747(-)
MKNIFKIKNDKFKFSNSFGQYSKRNLFELPPLKYNINEGLKPVISPKALDLHYNKHHNAYVNNANRLATGTEYESKTLEEVIISTSKIRSQAVLFNNVAQIYNHTFFWESMKPNGSEPSEKMKALLGKHFGSFDKFKEQFSHNATAVFGSGWTWLVDNNGHLEITNTFNAGTPITNDLHPLLTIDVWEHSYYVDFENRRPEYIKNWWSVVDWENIERRFLAKGSFDKDN